MNSVHHRLKIAALFFTFFLLLGTALAKVKRCEKGIRVELDKAPSRFHIRLPVRAPKCYWGVFGGENCVVQLSCTVDIPKVDDDCSDEFLKISDGSFGYKKFCGKTEFTKLKPKKGLKHLFIAVETEARSGSSSKNYKGISCTATCDKDGSGEEIESNIEKKTDPRCVCGLQNMDDRIVGGEDAKMGEFPWQAAIVYPHTRSPSCGASVINDRFILTAAHCFWFEDKQPDGIEVLLHANLLDMTKKKNAKDVNLGQSGSIRSSGYAADKKSDEDERTQRFQVLEIINHPLFNEYYDYDYALLRLDKKINLAEADAPTPICLPPATIGDAELAGWEGKNLTVSGWGLAAENAGGTTRQLQKLDVPYIPFSKCKESNPELVTDRMICAGYEFGEKDACTGDSGGPLVRQTDSKQFRQVGVVSWGEGCARAGKPGVYSKVTEMIQWIHFHTTEQESKWCQETK